MFPHKLHIIARNEWFPLILSCFVNLEFLLASICFVTPLNWIKQAASRHHSNFSETGNRNRQFFQVRLDNELIKHQNNVHHQRVISSSLLVAFVRSLGVFNVTKGSSLSLASIVLERTWHFFSEDEGKYLDLQILFQQFWLMNSVSNSKDVKHIVIYLYILKQVMVNNFFLDICTLSPCEFDVHRGNGRLFATSQDFARFSWDPQTAKKSRRKLDDSRFREWWSETWVYNKIT